MAAFQVILMSMAWLALWRDFFFACFCWIQWEFSSIFSAQPFGAQKISFNCVQGSPSSCHCPSIWMNFADDVLVVFQNTSVHLQFRYSWVMLRLCCSMFSTKRVPRWHMYLESLSCSSQRRTWLVQMDKTACWLHIMERCLTTNSSGYSLIVLDSNCLGVAGCGCNCSVEDSCCI